MTDSRPAAIARFQRISKRLLVIGLVGVLSAGCSKANNDEDQPAGAGPEQATESAPGSDAAEASEEAQAYYASLLEQHGGDYAACDESDATQAKACADAQDPNGADASGPANVLVMLDASGSMAGKVDGERKLTVAQDALLAFSRKLPDDAQLALRVYGHTGNNQDSGKAESCAGSELLQGFGTQDPAAFEQVVRSFKPVGWTPIAASLDAAAGDFAGAGHNDRRNVIYVVSDGIETCDGDPVAAARRLNQSDVRVIVNVIGFDVGEDDARQLRAVAGAGGGEYLAASNGSDLQRIFFSARNNRANIRYICGTREQHRAYAATARDQHVRYTCLSRRAYDERAAVTRVARRDYDDERITLEQRDHAISRAEQKFKDVMEPARQERDAVMERARSERDEMLSQERSERDRRRDDAKRERDDAQQD